MGSYMITFCLARKMQCVRSKDVLNQNKREWSYVVIKLTKKDSILLSTHIIVIFLCHYITRKCSRFLFCKANQLWHVLFMNYCRFFLFSLRIQWSWGKKGLQSNKKFNHQLKNYMKIDHSFMSWRDLLNDLSLCEE